MLRALRKLKLWIIKVRRDEKGVAIVEFAIIALPFLGLILGMLEVGLIFWAGYELDNATVTASRLIKTGQAQKGNYSKADMVSQICSHVAIFSDCTGKLKLTVQNFTSFDCVAIPKQPGCTPLIPLVKARKSNWLQAPTNGPSSISRRWRYWQITRATASSSRRPCSRTSHFQDKLI